MRSQALAVALLIPVVACDRPLASPPPVERTHDLVFEYRGAERAIIVLVDESSKEYEPLVDLGMEMKDPSPSPDGLRIAFVSRTDEGADDIWVVNRDGSGLARLTSDPARDDQPAWSPDGSRIAFRSFRDGELGDIWAMGADGTGQVNLTPDPPQVAVGDREPAWSPDGEWIAFSSGTGDCGRLEAEIDANWHDVFTCPRDLWTMAADGSDPRLLIGGGGYQGSPSWSPDGGAIAFSTSAQGGNDLAIAWFGGEVTVFRRAGGQGMPTWSPAGDRVYFTHSYRADEPSVIVSVTPDFGDLRLTASGQAPNTTLDPTFLRRP